MNHALDGTSIVFRSAVGSKLQAAESTAVVAFEVDGYEAALQEGWSVVVAGTAEVVIEAADPVPAGKLRAAGLVRRHEQAALDPHPADPGHRRTDIAQSA